MIYEHIKVVFPLIADNNPTTTIVFVVFCVRVEATGFHLFPGGIKRMVSLVLHNNIVYKKDCVPLDSYSLSRCEKHQHQRRYGLVKENDVFYLEKDFIIYLWLVYQMDD